MSILSSPSDEDLFSVLSRWARTLKGNSHMLTHFRTLGIDLNSPQKGQPQEPVASVGLCHGRSPWLALSPPVIFHPVVLGVSSVPTENTTHPQAQNIKIPCPKFTVCCWFYGTNQMLKRSQALAAAVASVSLSAEYGQSLWL